MNSNTLHTPYGAYELKASYQLNLALANLAVICLAGLVFLAVWIAMSSAEVAPPPVPVETLGKSDTKIIKPPPTIIKEKPSIKAEGPKVAPPKSGPVVIVEGGPEHEGGDMLPTKDERAAAVDHEFDGTDDGGGFVIDTSWTEFEDPSKPVEIGFVEIPPTMIDKHTPEYPYLAKMAGITGVVWIRALINEEGKVTEAAVHVSSEVTSLDEAAVEAAYKNVYSPAIQNGRPIPCWVTYSVNFELD